jgi:hypothetical protein
MSLRVNHALTRKRGGASRDCLIAGVRNAERCSRRVSQPFVLIDEDASAQDRTDQPAESPNGK